MQDQPTKQHLLEVGLRLFRADGYTATGLNEILAEAKTPKGSFYPYFATKEAFAQDVLELYVQQELRRAATLLAGDRQPLKRLRRYFEDLIQIFGPASPTPGCLLGKLSLELAPNTPALQSQLHAAFAEWQGAIAAVLREAIHRHDLSGATKPDPLAAFLINSYEGALLRSTADRSTAALDTFLYYALDVLLK